MFPEVYEQIPSYQKARDWNIPTGLKYRDKYGNIRYHYIAIRKDQSQRALGAVFEGLMAKAMGKEVDGDAIVHGLTDMSPAFPLSVLPPSMAAYWGYWTNYDFWRDKKIWAGRQTDDPTVETDPTVSPLANYVAPKLGLSPKRVEYAFRTLIPPSNFFVSLGGGIVNQMMDETPEKTQKEISEKISRIPGINRVFKTTPPYVESDIKRGEASQLKEGSRRQKQDNEIDRLMVLHGDKTEAEKYPIYADFIRAQPEADRKRLIQRFEKREAYRDTFDRYYWLKLKKLPPKQRAEEFYEKIKDMSKEEKNRYLLQADKLPGIASKPFLQRFDQLMRGTAP